MYTDSPARVEFAYDVVRDILRKVGVELMPISIIKIWCRNDRSQPLSNDYLVNTPVHDVIDYFLNVCSFGTNKLD